MKVIKGMLVNQVININQIQLLYEQSMPLSSKGLC